jgi:crotonobetainyl-CoA:carnitine CoA-transferase CaiB-like acyl-CoA transferase
VLGFADALRHPQIVERGVLLRSQVGDDVVVVTDPAIGIAKSEGAIRVAGRIGRDTESILTGLLGLDLRAVQALREKGVIA